MIENFYSIIYPGFDFLGLLKANSTGNLFIADNLSIFIYIPPIN